MFAWPVSGTKACLELALPQPLSHAMFLASNRSKASLNHRLNALQAGLDLIDQGFTLTDEKLQVVAWNQALIDLFEFPPSMFYEGAPLESFVRFNAERGEHGQGDVEHLVHARMAMAQSFKPYVFEHFRPNGTILRIDSIPVPGHGFITLYSDITEQKRQQRQIHEQTLLMEARLQERTLALSETNNELRQTLADKEAMSRSLLQSESRMRLITDSIPALIAYFDRNRVYHYVNRGYQDWFGLDTTQPQNIRAKEFLGNNTFAQIKPNIGKALAGTAVTFEYEVKAIDGNTKVVRTSLIPDIEADGNVIGCFELTFDISSERHSHQLLAQAQKMEAVGQLTGGMAHDFNNILTVILGNLTALSEQASIAPMIQEYVAPAIEAARRGSELINGLLSFSRKQPIEPEVVDINTQLLHVERLVSRTLPSSMTMDVQIEKSPLLVRTNPNQFQNAVLNLIINARDASNSKGLISVSCSAASLNASDAFKWHLPVGNYVRVKVRDFGCGMDEITRSRAFEPFFTTKPVGQGNGLGLSMVYGFVRQTAGAVYIESAQNEGTCFNMLLPSFETGPDRARPGAAPDMPEPNSQGLSLLVEDDAGVRQLVRRYLLELGYSVVEAENGVEAQDILQGMTKIDLLLSDIAMPGGVDGREVARQALARGDIPKVLLMSGLAPETGVTLPIPLLAKPFSKAQLAAALQPVKHG